MQIRWHLSETIIELVSNPLMIVEISYKTILNLKPNII